MGFVLRRIDEFDCRDVWDWRNHPVARANSIQKDEIPFEVHKKWFDNFLKDSKRTGYIAIDDKVKVGQVRFDEMGNGVSRIAVTVNPNFYGKGYGTKIVVDGSIKYLLEHLQTTKIFADIQKNNPASIKVFDRAGYVKDENYKWFGDERDEEYSYYWFSRGEIK